MLDANEIDVAAVNEKSLTHYRLLQFIFLKKEKPIFSKNELKVKEKSIA